MPRQPSKRCKTPEHDGYGTLGCDECKPKQPSNVARHSRERELETQLRKAQRERDEAIACDASEVVFQRERAEKAEAERDALSARMEDLWPRLFVVGTEVEIRQSRFRIEYIGTDVLVLKLLPQGAGEKEE